MIRKLSVAIVAAGLLSAFGLSNARPAWAWGGKGHLIINHVAAQALPAALPSFLHAQNAVGEIGFLGPELDNLKGSGEAWDAEKDPGHYVDLRDDGTIAGVVTLAALPATREAYDTALRAGHTDQYKQGYLPYALLEGWEQLREDFAYWRVDDYNATHGANVEQRAFAGLRRATDEAVTLRDIGVWGHYVGDASQPLHTTVHFNGWGAGPNPDNYSQSRHLHAMFESDFVDKYVDQASVSSGLPALAVPAGTSLATQPQVMSAIATYLRASNATVPQLYQIEKRNGFARGSREAVAFARSRLAAGAAELRDLVTWAWENSLYESVGYPAQPVQDLLNGAVPRANSGAR